MYTYIYSEHDHLLSPHLLSPHLLFPHLLSIHLLSASIAIRSICYQASLVFKTFALQSAINADLLSKTSYRGVQKHLCRGGTLVPPPLGNIVPPLKPPFRKNIDTFFNYVNYSCTHVHITTVNKLFM